MKHAWSVLVWLVSLAAVGGAVLAAFFINGWMRAERAAEAKGDKVASSVEIVKRVIDLGESRAQRTGVKQKPAEKVRWQERVTAYGQVVPNPRATTEVRAAFAGTLRAGKAGWPMLGDRVRANDELAQLEIRVGPQERLDWKAKLAEAKAKAKGAREVVKIQQDRVGRLKGLTGSEAVSRRELDEALVQLAEAKAQLDAADAAERLWQKALDDSNRTEGGDTTLRQPLTAPADGEVTEQAARPGTAVEAGSLVVRVVDFRRPLVRLELPPEALTDGAPRAVPLVAASRQGTGKEAPALTGELIGAAPQVDGASQMAAFWYEVKLPKAEDAIGGRTWRPGLPVKAQLVIAGGTAQDAVAVPASALLYHQGFPQVYVAVGPGRYERRDVQVLGRDGERWVLSKGVKAGEEVVYEQAQTLLSEEFNKADND